MTVTPLGSGRFTVEVSSPKRERFTVDVRAWGYNGECTCPTFHGFCLFMLTNQAERWRRHRCDHIIAAREWIVEHEYPALIERTEKIIEMPVSQSVQGEINL